MAYTLTGKKCGVIRFVETENGTITKESLSTSTKITDNPIEDGSSITDHVFNNPDQFSISGVAIGKSNDIQSRLNAMIAKGDIITYAGRIRVDNLVIQSFTPDYSYQNKNGFGFSISFKKVKISTSEYVEMGAAPLMSKQDAGKSGSTGSTAAKTASKTDSAVKADGLKTTVSTTISTSAYTDYVNKYNSKPASSTGPASRNTPSYTGIGK